MILVKDVRLDILRDASAHPDIVVRAVHLPTNTVVESDVSKSQFKAKVQALSRLREKVEHA